MVSLHQSVQDLDGFHLCCWKSQSLAEGAGATIRLHEMSRDQNPGYLLHIGDEILPSYIGIIIKH